MTYLRPTYACECVVCVYSTQRNVRRETDESVSRVLVERVSKVRGCLFLSMYIGEYHRLKTLICVCVSIKEKLSFLALISFSLNRHTPRATRVNPNQSKKKKKNEHYATGLACSFLTNDDAPVFYFILFSSQGAH